MASLTTRPGAYQVLHTVADLANTPDTDLAAATGYTIAVPSAALDLVKDNGAGKDTYANTISIIVNATGAADGDTITEKLYGISGGGPPQLIASISWTIGTARVIVGTATHLWADTATVTSAHVKTITVADGSGSNRVCSVTFDAGGFRHILGLFTADTGDPIIVTAYYRYF
jgi:hypothetical protein